MVRKQKRFSLPVVLVFFFLLSITDLNGQIPHFISYQAIINDSGGNPVSGTVGLKISILQGSEEGAVIYSERHQKDVDKRGLISLNIGEGDDIYYGEFDTIDWNRGPYFVKVEISPSGGFTYPVTTISKLLSVPFALYALKADSVSENFTEEDPSFKASVSYLISAEDTIRWNSLSQKLKHHIGEFFGGGIIFYLEPDGEHGLIASLSDIIDNVTWSLNSDSTEAISTFNGATNTEKIVSEQGEGNYAAFYCDTLTTGSYSDWYLPSADELFLLFKVTYVINKNLSNDGNEDSTPMGLSDYWTSSQCNANEAFKMTAGSIINTRKSSKASVRAIRAF